MKPLYLSLVCILFLLPGIARGQADGAGGAGARSWRPAPKPRPVGFDLRAVVGTWTGTIDCTTTRTEPGKAPKRKTTERAVELIIAEDGSIEAKWAAAAAAGAEENWGKAIRKPGERGLWIEAPAADAGQTRGLWLRSDDGGKTLRIEYVEQAATTSAEGTAILKDRS